jgi:hypothetical protein
MFRSILTAGMALAVTAIPLHSQNTIQAFGGDGQRAEASLFLAKIENGQFAGAAGAVFITYGAPQWKEEYAEQVDAMTKGKIFRLGKDNWASCDNSAPLSFGNVTVPAGVWYLAIARDNDGKWSLVFIDPAKAKAAGAYPFAADNAPRTHVVPLSHKAHDDVAEKLSITFDKNKQDPTKGTLVIHWGDQMVSAAYQVKVADGDSKGDAKKEK